MPYRKSEKMVKRKQERRRLFLDTAIAVFGRLGYHAATVPMMVAEAQSSTGAFYLYFRNKEDVYAQGLQEIGARLADALNAAIGQQTTPAARMGAAIEGFVQWLAANPAETRMLMEAATLGGRPEQVRRGIIESHVRSVAAALRSVAPSMDPVDCGVMARCWTGAAIEATAGWLLMEPAERPDVARLARIVKGFNLRGADIART